MSQRHGRVEVRETERCVVPVGGHGWTGLRVAFRVRSQRTVAGTTTEVRYGISTGAAGC